MKYKYDYDICKVPDEDIFKRQCEALEKKFPNFKDKHVMQDVDGTRVCVYKINGKRLTVANDVMLGVMILSDFDIDPYFEKEGPIEHL